MSAPLGRPDPVLQHITVVTPILLMGGVIAFRRGGRTRTRDLGRVLIGIGLMLLALHIFLGALVTTESAVPSRRRCWERSRTQPILCLAIAAAVTWAAHSSVAVVLVVMSLGAAHLVSPTAELALVLGANVGSALESR
jgi:phosphate:Na+ symporter